MLYGVSKLCSACSIHFQAASPPPLLIFLDHYCLMTLVMAIFNKYASFKSALTMGNSHIIAHFFPPKCECKCDHVERKKFGLKGRYESGCHFLQTGRESLSGPGNRVHATDMAILTDYSLWCTYVQNCCKLSRLKNFDQRINLHRYSSKKGTYKEKVSISDGYSFTGMPHTALH